MHLYGAAMVRNEADIIEAFVRHNLAVLDGLAVVDHGSVDGTAEILAALVAEGLPLAVVPSTVVPHLQSEITTRLVRDLFARSRADFVFVVDADEFLRMPSRPLVEDVLGRMPRGMHALLQWQTYVPDFSIGGGVPGMRALLASARRLDRERQRMCKVVAARHFLDEPDAFVEAGNHVIWPSRAHRLARSPNPHVFLEPHVAALAHVPVRSVDQFTAKVAVGWLAMLAGSRNGPPDAGFHWKEAYRDIAAGVSLSPDVLATIACNYSIRKSEWLPAAEVDTVVDPFLADFELRYSHLSRQKPLPLVLAFAERLIGGTGAKPPPAGPTQ
jgi:hypothetical protein